MSDSGFYRAFENKYRGSRELIINRLNQYLPFIEPLKEIYKGDPTFDIGCGRGEWLQLMQDNGFSPYGVDLDQGMLKACEELGLDVSQGDAIDFIKGLASDSQVVLTAFHVVEHISFEDLQVLIKESLRVLKPGGILIMETPNPENIKVATESFYLDPTHVKPIPSDLLSFLPEYYGYQRIKIVRLQESTEIRNKDHLTLNDVIRGVSPDYAVIAQKDAEGNILRLFDDTFSLEFGCSLDFVTEKFESRLIRIEAKVSEAEAKASEAEAKASEVIANSRSQLNELLGKLKRATNLPIRALKKVYRIILKGIRLFSADISWREKVKRTIVKFISFIDRYPKVKNCIKLIYNRFSFLRKLYVKLMYSSCSKKEIIYMSAREEKIFKDLNLAISKGEK